MVHDAGGNEASTDKVGRQQGRSQIVFDTVWLFADKKGVSYSFLIQFKAFLVP